MSRPFSDADLDLAAALLAERHAPVFGPGRAGWDESEPHRQIIGDVHAADLLVAERNGLLVGCVYLEAREADLHRPSSAFLAWAATRPEVTFLRLDRHIP